MNAKTKTKSEVLTMPAPREYNHRLSDVEKDAIDALNVGECRVYEESETAACAYSRLKYSGKRPVRKSYPDGKIRIWRAK